MNEDDLNTNAPDDMDDLEAQLAALGFGGDDASEESVSSADDLDAQFAALGNDDDESSSNNDDLEAQLAALGLGGSDDIGGGGEDNRFSVEDDDDPFGVMLEEMGQAGGSDVNDPFAGGDLDDLDRQLDLLLSADKNADESFEMMDVSKSTPTEIIYDPEAEGLMLYVRGETVIKEETAPKKRLFENVRVWHLIAVAVVGVLFILTSALTAIWATNTIREQEEVLQTVAHFSPIVMPVNVANNANAIFVNQHTRLNGQSFTLSRISAGYSGTFFYFDEHFDTEQYVFLLYDQFRTLFTRSDFDIQAEAGSGTVLKFAPLHNRVVFLTLRIQCVSTHSVANFYFRFENAPVLASPIYITHPVPVIEGEDSDLAGFTIRHAVFDNASSQIHYSFSHDPHATGIRKRTDRDGPFVALHDGISAMTVFTNENAFVDFSDISDFDIVMGTATFGSVFSLNGRVEVILSDLAYFYPYPNIDIAPRDLFGRDQRFPHTVDTGPFRLNLEGMAQQGSNVVLVLHGTDENGVRTQTVPTVSLRIDVGTNVIDIPGNARYLAMGTDVVFNLSPYLAQIRDVNIDNYALVFHSVEYAVPQIAVPVQLSQDFNLPRMRRVAAEVSVYEAFRGLLGYMSGEMDRDGIVGLAPMLDNQQLFDIFAPRHVLQERPMYGVQMVTGDLISNYDYFAIVQVQWVGGEGVHMDYFNETFRVTARSRDAIWGITNIEILSDSGVLY